MARTIQKTIYTYSELSGAAKEHAANWWRELVARDFDHDFVLEDAENVAAILGIEFDYFYMPTIGGKSRRKSKIHYSGFYSQGDGACFEGSYSYKAGSAKAIREYAPQDNELHAIADGLSRVQKRHFYRLTARATHVGRYYHEFSMSIDVEDSRDEYRDIGEDAELLRDLLRDFARWIYARLRDEYEYRMSDESLEESMLVNEYEFDEFGRIV